MTERISINEIMAALEAEGVPVSLMYTGGGNYVLYAGAPTEDDENPYPASIGPAYESRDPDDIDFFGQADDLYVTSRDDGTAPVVRVASATAAVAEAVRLVREASA